MEGTEKKERRIYQKRRNKTWSERERDGGVLIREATVMPRPTTTTLPPPPPPRILTTNIQKAIRHRRDLSSAKIYDACLNIRNEEKIGEDLYRGI